MADHQDEEHEDADDALLERLRLLRRTASDRSWEAAVVALSQSCIILLRTLLAEGYIPDGPKPDLGPALQLCMSDKRWNAAERVTLEHASLAVSLRNRFQHGENFTSSHDRVSAGVDALTQAILLVRGLVGASTDEASRPSASQPDRGAQLDEDGFVVFDLTSPIATSAMVDRVLVPWPTIASARTADLALRALRSMSPVHVRHFESEFGAMMGAMLHEKLKSGPPDLFSWEPSVFDGCLISPVVHDLRVHGALDGLGWASTPGKTLTTKSAHPYALRIVRNVHVALTGFGCSPGEAETTRTCVLNALCRHTSWKPTSLAELAKLVGASDTYLNDCTSIDRYITDRGDASFAKSVEFYRSQRSRLTRYHHSLAS